MFTHTHIEMSNNIYAIAVKDLWIKIKFKKHIHFRGKQINNYLKLYYRKKLLKHWN